MPSENTEQRKLAAIMFTDMVGYSSLSQRNEALALELLAENQRLLRTQFPLFNGREVKTTGDGFLVEFPSALQATQCAVEIQRAVVARNSTQPAERQIHVRIGIHVGDVVHREADMYGDGVNIAARIEPLAIGGGICLSDAVYGQVRNKLGAQMTKLDQPQLKNIDVPMDIYRIVLPWETPSSSSPKGSQTSKSEIRNPKSEIEKSPVTSAATKWVGIAALLLLAAGGGWWFVHQSGPATKTIAQSSTNSASAAASRVTLNPPPVIATPDAVDQKSIAVLAFANLSEDKGNETFSEGVSEELLNVLAKIPGLKVTARTSAFHFKGKDTPIPEIARQLGVAYVVEGSVRKSDNRVRITAQLIKAADGFHVWSDTFPRDLKDIFAVQEEIAGLIAEQLQLKLGMSSRATQVVNPEAHRLVLEGRYFWNLRSEEGFARAETAFKQALVIDPQFAPARAGLALNYVIRGQYRVLDGIDGGLEDWALGRTEAQKAIDLDPLQAEPYAALAYAVANEGRWKDSEQLFQKAFALNPNYAMAHFWHALVLANQGRLDLSLDEHRRAGELDPLSFIIIDRIADELRFAGHFTEAIESSRRAAELRTDIFIPNLGTRVMALLALGRQAEAIELARTIRQAVTLRPRWNSDGYAIWALERAGLKQEAADYAAEIIKLPEERYVRGFALVALGRFAEALPSLEHTPPITRRLLFWDTLFDPWRDDPRFQQLLVKLNCAAEYQVARETLTRMPKEREAK